MKGEADKIKYEKMIQVSYMTVPVPRASGKAWLKLLTARNIVESPQDLTSCSASKPFPSLDLQKRKPRDILSLGFPNNQVKFF